jgi:hypothetical protein
MLALLFALTLLTAAPTDSVTVRFEVVVPGVLAPLDTVYVAGSFNHWDLGDGAGKAPLPMEPTGAGEVAVQIQVARGEALAYTYTLGNRYAVEVDAERERMPNREAVAGGSLVLRDTVAHWSVASVERGRWSPEDVARLTPGWPGDLLEDERLSDASPHQFDSLMSALSRQYNASLATVGFEPRPLPLPFLDKLQRSAPWLAAREVELYQGYRRPAALALLQDFEARPPDQRSVQRLVYLDLNLAESPFMLALPGSDVLVLLDDVNRLRAHYAGYLAQRPADEASVKLARERLERLDQFAAVLPGRHLARTGRTREALALLTPLLQLESASWFALMEVTMVSMSDDPSDALPALDLMVPLLPEQPLLSRDLLIARYQELDPQGGLARFEGVEREASGE